MKPLRILFLVSGSGGSLKVVHQAADRLLLPMQVVMVLADRACGALAYAAQAGIPHQQLMYSRKSPAQLQQAIADAKPDVVVTNIHKIIDSDTLGLVPGGFINLHYSLLPAFKGFIGMETLEQARQLNVTIVGATCHEVDEQVDNGRCIGQFAVGIDWQQDTTAKAYDLMFRGAGLVLLQGLLQRTLHRATGPMASADILGKKLLFAPPLAFDVPELDEPFWQGIKGS